MPRFSKTTMLLAALILATSFTGSPIHELQHPTDRPHDPLPSHTARNQYVQLSTPMPALMTHIDPQHPAHKHLAPLPCLTTCTCLYSHSPYEVDFSLRHLTTSPQPQQSTSYQPTPMPHSSYTPPTQIHIPSYPTHTLTIAHSLAHPPRRTPTPLRPPQ